MLKNMLILLVIAGALAGMGFGASHLYRAEENATPDVENLADSAPADIGPPLYEARHVTKTAAPRSAVDPLAIGDCRVVVFEKEDAPAQHEGVILFIGTEVADGEVVPADRLIKVPGDPKRYRKLREGDTVKAGQLLARLEDRVARSEVSIKKGKLAVARAELSAAEKTRDEARSRLDNGLRLNHGKAIAAEDLAERRLAFEKLQCEVAAKKEAVELARLEQDQAQALLENYEIRSSIDGILKTIFKNPGEAVKSAPSYEPVFQIWNLGRLRVEGLVAEQHLARLRVGDSVKVEAPAVVAPRATLVGHLQEVTAICTSADGNCIASASLDHTVRIWNLAERREQHVLRQPGAVTALAASPVANACISGGSDGTLRHYNLQAAQPEARVFAERHAGAVQALAFSPDGMLCASGGDDRAIHIWDVNTGDLRYRLLGHSGAITALGFTPDCRLVSAARDNSLRLWELGRDAGRLLTTLPRRSGDIARPGIATDGQSVIFDPAQDRSLRVLSLPDGRTEQVLTPPSGSGRFATFALFAPQGQSLVTSGATDGRLQMWDLHDAARAHVTQNLMPDVRVTPTCAAFTPDGRHVVAGTRERQVLVWPTGPGTKPLCAEITHIERALDSQQVRVWAELHNPDGRLLPGTVVTLVK